MSIDHSSSVKSRRLAEQAIGDAMDDLAQRNDARVRRESEQVISTRDRVVRIGLVVALPVLVMVTAWNVTGAAAIAAPLIGLRVSRADVEAALKAVVEDIEAFEADYGELPVNLAETGLPTGGEWRYTRLPDDRYRLVVQLGGHVVTFERR